MTFISLLRAGSPAAEAVRLSERYWRSISSAKLFNSRRCGCCTCDERYDCLNSYDEGCVTESNHDDASECVCTCPYPSDFMIDIETLHLVIEHLRKYQVPLSYNDFTYTYNDQGLQLPRII